MTPRTSDQLSFEPMTLRANDFWPIELLTFGLPTLRTNVSWGKMTFKISDLWKRQKFSDQWPFGLTSLGPMTLRTIGPIFGMINHRTIDMNDKQYIRTHDRSDYWTFVSMERYSDQCPPGLPTYRTIQTSARFSDQWTLGPTTIRNIELSGTATSPYSEGPLIRRFYSPTFL